MIMSLRCLVLSDGRRGIENQALGLAEALERLRPTDLRVHTLEPNPAMAAMPPRLQQRLGGDFGLPHDTDIVIGCGRQAIGPLLGLKRAAPQVFTTYIQDPRLDPSGFDLVIAPEHDAIRGPNVETIIGSPNRVTQERIIGETLKFAKGLNRFSMPRATLLIGGNSKTHKLDSISHAAHLAAAKDLRAKGYSLLVTTSRRTPEFAAKDWANLASDHDNIWLHNGDGPNPYFAFLGGGDIILVTEDSTNMLTESCTTGKPVYRLPMGGKAGKFATLYESLEKRCNVLRWNPAVESKDYSKLCETDRLAQILLSRYALRATRFIS